MQVPVAAATWTEVQLDGPPGGFVSTDAVHIYFDVGKSRSPPVTVKELTMNACIRVGLSVHLSVALQCCTDFLI